MDVISTISELRERLGGETRTAFVPTMGNLHEGHLALVRIARAHGRPVVASIFVNPLQFGPREDFNTYPRTLGEDLRSLEAEGTDVVFTPALEELYPVAQETMVEPPPMGHLLEGEFRPGFFRGVATVVLKLFHIVQPAAAVFGKKDYQQLAVIRRMVREFNMPIEILAGETSRAADGLALSSRNGYLNDAQRREAPALYRALRDAEAALRAGRRDFRDIENEARSTLDKRGWRVDYVAVQHAHTLASAGSQDRAFVVLGAARLGSTRLIDNIEVFIDR